LGIKRKATKNTLVSINKYSSEEMQAKIQTAQQRLLEADRQGYIIYQLDETIFDAR
jgi:hypothetical protein